MEIRHQPVDRLEPVAGQNEQRRLAAETAAPCHPACAALSSSRRLVVPTATTRPPSRRTWLMVSAVSAVISPRSACMRWSVTRSTRTGRNVPIPTCSVTVTRRTPAASRSASRAGREVQPGGRRRHRTLALREHRLVIRRVGLGRSIRPMDIGRQSQSSGLLERLHQGVTVQIERQADAAVRILVGHPGGQRRRRLRSSAYRRPAAGGRCGRAPSRCRRHAAGPA